MEQDRDFMDSLREQDIAWRFLKTRKIFLWGAVDDELSRDVVSKLLLLEAENSKEDISVYLNSPGGIIPAGLAIYDAIQTIKPDVSVTCMGQAASMGAVLLAGGAKGKRFAWPHSRIMIHQPTVLGQIWGPATSIAIQSQEVLKLRDELNAILARHTGQSKETIEQDTDRDFFMSPEEAKTYGIIDGIRTSGGGGG